MWHTVYEYTVKYQRNCLDILIHSIMYILVHSIMHESSLRKLTHSPTRFFSWSVGRFIPSKSFKNKHYPKFQNKCVACSPLKSPALVFTFEITRYSLYNDVRLLFVFYAIVLLYMRGLYICIYLNWSKIKPSCNLQKALTCQVAQVTDTDMKSFNDIPGHNSGATACIRALTIQMLDIFYIWFAIRLSIKDLIFELKQATNHPHKRPITVPGILLQMDCHVFKFG